MPATDVPLIIPAPLPPDVQRYDSAGRPTVAMVSYETKLTAALKAIKDRLDTL